MVISLYKKSAKSYLKSIELNIQICSILLRSNNLQIFNNSNFHFPKELIKFDLIDWNRSNDFVKFNQNNSKLFKYNLRFSVTVRIVVKPYYESKYSIILLQKFLFIPFILFINDRSKLFFNHIILEYQKLIFFFVFLHNWKRYIEIDVVPQVTSLNICFKNSI